ncbi:hypothetical protein Q0P22_15250, partial [Staphylococcus aureus]|nr:hypothetical protein [Staphylococcus aureus]
VRLEARHAALDAFVAFTEAVGADADLPTLRQRSVEATVAGLGEGASVAYERAGEVWRAVAWHGEVREDLLAVLRAGVPM